jgi:hypothetical protein
MVWCSRRAAVIGPARKVLCSATPAATSGCASWSKIARGHARIISRSALMRCAMVTAGTSEDYFTQDDLRALPYTVYMKSKDSAILTVRVTPALERRLEQEARRQRKTRSSVARSILEQALGNRDVDPALEARRQSLLASRRRSERETIAFVGSAADLRGWK